MRVVIRILFWSLIVGLVLAWLGWTPGDLLGRVLALLARLPEWFADIFGWAWPYMREGAVIVVPVAVIVLLMAAIRRRRGDGQGR